MPHNPCQRRSGVARHEVLQGLAPTAKPNRAPIDHRLCRPQAAVVIRRHGQAVRADALDSQKRALTHLRSEVEPIRQQIAGFAHRSGESPVATRFEADARTDQLHRVTSAVQHRPQQLGHTGVGDEMSSPLHTDDAGHEPPGVRDNAATGLGDQPIRVRQVWPDGGRILGRLADKAAPQIDPSRARVAGQAGEERRELRERRRIGEIGADVRADRLDAAAGTLQGTNCLGKVVERDPELGRRRASRGPTLASVRFGKWSWIQQAKGRFAGNISRCSWR